MREDFSPEKRFWQVILLHVWMDMHYLGLRCQVRSCCVGRVACCLRAVHSRKLDAQSSTFLLHSCAIGIRDLGGLVGTR